jgi:hypothetical protein
MQRLSFCLFVSFCFIATPNAFTASKPHVIVFGKWMSVKAPAPDATAMVELKVRGIFVDSRLKEYVSGNPHEVTDRLFVLRRAFRINDALPADPGTQWQWQPGGWLLVDRLTGRISQINLPDFDPFFSAVTWYRDYAAYCGLSEDGKKVSAIIAQIGRRKTVLKKVLGAPSGDSGNPGCPAPVWQRNPARVTFHPENSDQMFFSLRGHAVQTIDDEDPGDEE